jgi:hypothetical protein
MRSPVDRQVNDYCLESSRLDDGLRHTFTAGVVKFNRNK